MDRHEIDEATKRATRRRANEPVAVSARYDKGSDRVIIALSSGYDIAFSPRRAEGLQTAKPNELALIEITPSGFGLHFPKIDADLYLPSLLKGIFGSKHWAAAQLGERGGRVTTKAKARAARNNGKLGGRPKKVKSGRK